MLIDSGAVEAGDVALVGARNLDAPEEEFIRKTGLHIGEAGIGRALAGTGNTYVAFDLDVLDPSCFAAQHRKGPAKAIVALVHRLTALMQVCGG